MGKVGLILVFSLVLVLSIQSIVGHDQEDQNSSEFQDATGQSLSNSDGNVEEATAPELAQDYASSPTRSFARPFGPEPDQGGLYPENSGSEMATDEGVSEPTDGEMDNNKAQEQEEQNTSEYKDATGQSLSNSDGNVEEATAPELAGDYASSPTRSFARPFGPEPDQGGLYPENSGPEMATDEGGSEPTDSEMANEKGESEAENPAADNDTENEKED